MGNFLACVLVDLVVWDLADELFRPKVHGSFEARVDYRRYHGLRQQGLLEFYQLLVGDRFLGHGRQDSEIHSLADIRRSCGRPATPSDYLDRYLGCHGCRVLIFILAVGFLRIGRRKNVDLLCIDAAFLLGVLLGVDRVGRGLRILFLDHVNLAWLRCRLLSF